MKIEKERTYIVRSTNAGVFFGNIKEKNGDEVTLTNCRRLWYWNGAASLSQLAAEGVKKPLNCKFSMAVDEITILGVCEIIPCSLVAEANIKEVPIWRV